MADGAKATTTFERLLAKDVAKHVEKKGKFSYLSWAYAVAELGKECPTATWDVARFPLPGVPGLLVPYCETPTGYYVEVIVTVDGVRKSQVHPVLDERNGVIKSPNAFDINRAIQRALVKAIALHGLGLNVYAGEDLPLGDDGDEHPQAGRGAGGDNCGVLIGLISSALDELGYVKPSTQRDNRVRRVLKRDPVATSEKDLAAVYEDLKAELAAQVK